MSLRDLTLWVCEGAGGLAGGITCWLAWTGYRGRKAATEIAGLTEACTDTEVEEWVTGPLKEAAKSWAAVHVWDGKTAQQLAAQLAGQFLPPRYSDLGPAEVR